MNSHPPAGATRLGDLRYVDTPTALNELCTALQAAQVIALDTEFIREKTFYARPCLIQLATDEIIACVDPLALPDLDPLLAILEQPERLKVFHAARQDLEIFHDLWHKIPAPIFDTQIAAALLGYSDQIGYANLVRQLLGVELDKSATRTDWSQRPLSRKQLAYAADDVHYLLQMYPLLREQLKQQHRLDWLEEECRNLTNPALYTVSPESAWQRVKGSNKLPPQALAILQALAAWREQRARERDKPRKWILSDEVLLALAGAAPADMAALQGIEGLPAAVIRNSGQELLAMIDTARRLPPTAWPDSARQERLEGPRLKLVTRLMKQIRQFGEAERINPSTIASRKDIEKLVRGKRDLPLLRGWRKPLLGDTLLAEVEAFEATGNADSKD
jgi:ribonuclease D